MIDNWPYAPVCIDACPQGGGGHFAGQAFNIQWSDWPGAARLHINYLEVLALEPAAHLWAAQWANKIIKVHTDNQAACAIINRGTARNSFVMDS